MTKFWIRKYKFTLQLQSSFPENTDISSKLFSTQPYYLASTISPPGVVKSIWHPWQKEEVEVEEEEEEEERRGGGEGEEKELRSNISRTVLGTPPQLFQPLFLHCTL